ncbi:glutamate 5-kinase [Bacillus massiliglaciei]|uniref:glutamate 5-kinase n=1 Tax=Bacillus massiliglaciei TaxID=1816693 RepID=UPI000AF94149|nr:glutamate 5-kinase [Bacillus massiliglaciei]
MSKQQKKVKRVVIKIGSSSLTSMHGEISHKKLEKLTDQIVSLKDAGYETVLVSSGAVAAGYRKLGCLERPSSLPEKQAAASIGQGLLMESYSELFLSHGYVASQILITRGDFADKVRYTNMKNTLNMLLSRGIIPIINENDTVTVDRLKFGDNDTLSAKVAALIDADRLIILSDIDGLYSDNPRKNPHAKLVKKVHTITPEIEAAAGDSGSTVGTGGMKSKISAIKIAMASGINSFLGKAGTPDILMNALAGTAKGTYFELKPNAANLDNERQWIAFHSGPEGKIIISLEGRETLVNQQGDIEPGDVIKVSGSFHEGAVVRIYDENEKELGLGRMNCSSDWIDRESSENQEAVIIDQGSFVCFLDYRLPAQL